ncbi:MAG: TetR family transcriptional regulator [Myxococcota bacterium]
MVWERARRPEQKAERRESILEAAGHCFDAGGLAGATLTAIAQQAGLAASNLYRYFPSREAILIELLLREHEGWVLQFEDAREALSGVDDVDALVDLIRVSLLARPRLGALAAITRSVLEQNVGLESIVDFKRRSAELRQRTEFVVADIIPSLSLDQVALFVRYTNLVLGQIWSVAHPPKIIADAKAQIDVAGVRVDFGTTIDNFSRIMLWGLLNSEPGSLQPLVGILEEDPASR